MRSFIITNLKIDFIKTAKYFNQSIVQRENLDTNILYYFDFLI